MDPLSSLQVMGDVVMHHESPQFCYDSILLTNNTGAELNAVPGQLLNEAAGVWDPTLTGEHASVDGVLCEAVLGLANNGTREVRVLVRGPAVVNIDRIILVDKNAAVISEAGVITRLLALNILCRHEPPIQDTQTT